MTTPTTFAGLVSFFLSFLNYLVPLIFSITFLYIAWGVVKAWIINGGDPKSVEGGKQTAIVGVVALVFMFGVWGVITLLKVSLFPGM